jgi:hypothetical protein
MLGAARHLMCYRMTRPDDQELTTQKARIARLLIGARAVQYHPKNVSRVCLVLDPCGPKNESSGDGAGLAPRLTVVVVKSSRSCSLNARVKSPTPRLRADER